MGRVGVLGLAAPLGGHVCDIDASAQNPFRSHMNPALPLPFMGDGRGPGRTRGDGTPIGREAGEPLVKGRSSADGGVPGRAPCGGVDRRMPVA